MSFPSPHVGTMRQLRALLLAAFAILACLQLRLFLYAQDVPSAPAPQPAPAPAR